MKRTTKPKLPTHAVFIVEGEGETAFWTKIGAGWAHKNGDGINIQLAAMPTGGRLVIRTAKPRTDKGAAA